MKENKEEQGMNPCSISKEEQGVNRCSIRNKFIDLCLNDPELILRALDYNDIIKPIMYINHISNGGKLGTRGIAQKLDIRRNVVKRYLKKKGIKNGKNNSK